MDKEERMELESSKDLLLMLLYAPGITGEFNEPIRGKTRVTKLVFLFFVEYYKKFGFDKKIKNKPEFTAYKYGPFSKEVFEDLEFFENIDFVITKQEVIPELSGAVLEEMSKFNEDLMIDYDSATYEYEEEIFQLSDKGIKCAKGLFENLSSKQKEVLIELKKKYGSISLYALLEYVYKTYPKYAIKSEIKDRYPF